MIDIYFMNKGIYIDNKTELVGEPLKIDVNKVIEISQKQDIRVTIESHIAVNYQVIKAIDEEGNNVKIENGTTVIDGNRSIKIDCLKGITGNHEVTMSIKQLLNTINRHTDLEHNMIILREDKDKITVVKGLK